MGTPQEDALAYSQFKHGTMKPAPTRGVVVSTADPLFAGRVKVWIPSIHGPTPYDETGAPTNMDMTVALYMEKFPNRIAGSSTFGNQSTVDSLPWAIVLSFGTGPSQVNLTSGTETVSAGVFSVPNVGTEVMVVFENNDPSTPIIIGSIIHAHEFRFAPSRPLESLPGMPLSSVTQTGDPGNLASNELSNKSILSSYPTLATSSYMVQTKGGSTLFMSDDTNLASILLEGSISYGALSVLSVADESRLAFLYPAFPTTASAAFAKRQALSDIGNPSLAPPGTLGGGSSTTFSTVTTSGSAASEEIKNAIDAAFEAVKTLATINRQFPMSGPHKTTPSGHGIFLDRRTGSGLFAAFPYDIHPGIDLGTLGRSDTTKLIAPIDCFPLWYQSRGVVGILLLVLGVDGYCHGFNHLNNLSPAIKAMIDKGTPTLVKAGTPLAFCGMSIVSAANAAPHLHWETWHTGVLYSGSAIKSSNYSALRVRPGTGMIDPLLWLGKTGSGPTQINVTTEQSYTNTALSPTAANIGEFSKPAGLEMSLIPGKETITIRHPSGSYIGFDQDGNINIYSCGDINFRVNRSITYDILGAIMENAYAKFTRVRSVVKSWGKIYNSYRAKDQADSTMPIFYSRVDTSRTYDMIDAIRSTASNSFLINSNGELVNPASVASTNKPTVVYPARGGVYNPNYDNSLYEILQDNFTKYITSADAKSVIDVAMLINIMIVVTDGNADTSEGKPINRRNSDQSLGLFGLQNVMFIATGTSAPTTSNEQSYVSNTIASYKLNISVGVSYLNYVCKEIATFLKSKNISTDTNGGITKLDLQYFCLLAYVQGIGPTQEALMEVIPLLKAQTPPGGTQPPLTYTAVEAKLIPKLGISATALDGTDRIMSFVPTILKIHALINTGDVSTLP